MLTPGFFNFLIAFTLIIVVAYVVLVLLNGGVVQ